MIGKYDYLAIATSKQVSTTVSLAHALDHSETYDNLDPQGVAQCNAGDQLTFEPATRSM